MRRLGIVVVGLAVVVAALVIHSNSVVQAQPLIYLEGRIESGITCGCQFLHTFNSTRHDLWGDLKGLTCGDRVGVWGTVCTSCVSACMEGDAIILVQDIVRLPDPDSVGGIAELPAVAGTGGGSGMGGATYAVLAGAAAGVLAFAVLAGLSVKRRRVR